MAILMPVISFWTPWENDGRQSYAKTATMLLVTFRVKIRTVSDGTTTAAVQLVKTRLSTTTQTRLLTLSQQ